MTFAPWERILVLVLLAVSLGIFARDFRRRIALALRGRPDRVRWDHPGRRLARVVREVLFQSRVVSGRPVAGTMHALVFLGFVFFGFETIDHFLEPFGISYLDAILGPHGHEIFSRWLSLWAVLVAVAITGLALRRFVFVRYSPDPTSWSSGVVALFIFVLMVTWLHLESGPGPVLAKLDWWTHALVIIVFPHLILRSKHFHLLMAPVNIFFRTERLGELLPLDLDLEALEEAEEEISLGLEKLGDLTWKERLDFLTCVECRRCTDNCPASQAGQSLDPRGFILAGRHAIEERPDDDPVIGTVIDEEALARCTSCGACENICPTGIEHLQVLVGAKRAQALALGTGMVAADFLRDVERTGNALGVSRDARKKLLAELELPAWDGNPEGWLLWLGCVWSGNPDAKGAVRAMAELLGRAGVPFGVLPEESCCGHHSRRQGEEMQFQVLARENMERLRDAGVRRILTPCPHCQLTFRFEYPDLEPGFGVEVVHHSRFLLQLVEEGRLTLRRDAFAGSRATYHDPCYLGRYQGEYDAPRRLVRQAGVELVEMEKNRARSTCCGGGAAGFALRVDVKPRRIDQLRAEHVRSTGAPLLVTACPECHMMLNAATRETRDIAEIIRDAVG